MMMWPTRRLPPCWALVGLLLAVGAWSGGGFFAPAGQAQEQFFTQSGGRGLQNAKTNARLSKAENDIVVIQEDLRTIQPHARAQLGNCANDGEKLRYDGRNWICEQETDPTVQAFAKKELPQCSGTSILGVAGGELACVDSGFVSNELDPTVQAFAKAPLPGCGQDQVVTVQNNALVCINDQIGLNREVDPQVHGFARKDQVPALPNCNTNELLTMTNGRLACKVDMVGITEEEDPLVQDFARLDNGQPVLAACALGELVRSVTVDGKVVLQCQSASGTLTNALTLNDLSDVTTASATSGTVLTFSGGQWRPVPGVGSNDNPIFLGQLGDVEIAAVANGEVLRWTGSAWENADDLIGALTDTNWCRASGGQIVCDRPAPLTCGASEMLRWNGGASTWSCEDISSVVGGSLSLNDLNDVAVSGAQTGQVLRYNGTAWVHQTLERILAGDSQVVITDTGSNGQIVFATDGATRMVLTPEGRLGIGVTPASPLLLDVGGDARVTNLTVTGNLSISGSQSLDGVLFANGGIQMPGTLEGGVVSTTNLSATVADLRGVNVINNLAVGGDSTLTGGLTVSGLSQLGALTAASTTLNRLVVDNDQLVRGNLTVGGDLNISGSQSIDGVIFANGGIEMPGTLTGGTISTTNLSATVADLRGLNVTNNLAVGGDSALTGGLTVSGLSQLGALTAASTTLNRLVVTTDGLVNGDFSVAGNLNVSGSQSIDGVLFANGGIEMPGTLTSGNVSVTNLSATVADIRGLNVTNNLAVGGDTTLNGGLTVAGATQLSDISASGQATISGSLTAATGAFGGLATTNFTATSATLTTLAVSTEGVIGGDLTVAGTLNVSGSQSIDGVLFANGGIEISGTFSSGNVSVTNLSATVADIRGLNVTNNLAVGGESAFTGGLTVGGNTELSGTLTAASTTLQRLAVTTDGVFGGDLTVAGTLNVSGSQNIDGVIFANGGIEMPGTLTSGNISVTNLSATVADIRGLNVENDVTVGGNTALTGSLTAASTTLQRLAVTTDGLVGGDLAVSGAATVTGLTQLNGGLVAASSTLNRLVVQTNGLVEGDLTVRGNFFVSGSQSIDGVTFANGGVQATGTVSATQFSGDGSGLTNIPATGLQAAGMTGSVQVRGVDGRISGTSNLVWDDSARHLEVAGTVSLAGTGSEPCALANRGTLRFVDAGSGNFRLQICRP